MKNRMIALGMCAAMMAGMCAGGTAMAEGTAVTVESQGIGLEGVNNARQLGGYVGADGKKVKMDVLLRTGKLTGATEEDIKKLTDTYHVTEIMDFRTTPERTQEPDPEIEGVKNLPISIIEESEDNQGSSVTAAYADDPVQAMIEYVKSANIAEMYTDIAMSEHSQEGYAQFFDELLNHEDGAILWHCTGGKDRAGFASVLLLSALGVDEDTILADFALSNEYYTENIEQMGQAAEAKGCTEEEIAAAKTLAGVNADYMKDTLEKIDSEYGSMKDYLNEQIQVSDEDIAALQAMYLE